MQATYHPTQPRQPLVESMPRQQMASGMGTDPGSYRGETLHDDATNWHSMSMDCDMADKDGAYYSLEEAAAQAKARMPIGARMGLSASISRSSVGSEESSSSFETNEEEEEPSLSRSPESTRSSFPCTPARGEFVRKLHGGQGSLSSPNAALEEQSWEGYSKHTDAHLCSPKAGLSSLLNRNPEHFGNSNVVPRTSLGQSLGLSVKPKAASGHHLPCESPLSHQNRGQRDTASHQQSFKVAPSNLAARRNLPPLAIRGTNGVNGTSSTMPHTPGGTVFAGARDGAAHGGQTPISPFIPPTPLVSSHAEAVAASPSPYNTQKRGSLPNVLAPFHQSPMQRQGSLGPMSPLSRDFAAVSVRGPAGVSQVSSGSSSSASSSSASSASTNLTTPEVSPLVTARKLSDDVIEGGVSLSRQSSAESTRSKKRSKDSSLPDGSCGAARPKLLKSKSTNRASPYPTRDGTLASPKTPRKGDNALKSNLLTASSALLTPPTMEKSLSAPAPVAPQTVSATHLSGRQLHPDFAANYTIADELGSGGFGFVVSATRNKDQRPVAVKFIWKEKVPTHGWVRDPTLGVIPLEAFVLRVVDHPCVVKFIDLFDDDDFFYLVMEMHGTPWQAPEAADAKKTVEDSVASKPASSQDSAVLQSPQVAVFAPDGTDATDALAMDTSCNEAITKTPATKPASKGLTPPRPAPMERRTSHDLFECIEQHTRFSEDVAAWVFAQIVEAVYYLAKLGICHRDIKDENCVIDSDWNVKLIDFGSAVISDPRKPAPYFNRFFGTMTFASSEILKGQQYRAPHAEVWSLGVLLSILLSGECPFSDPDAAVTGRISSRVRHSWSPEALNLLSGCVQPDPDKRATIAQVREHPWVRRAWESRGLRRPSAPRIFEERQ